MSKFNQKLFKDAMIRHINSTFNDLSEIDKERLLNDILESEIADGYIKVTNKKRK